MKTDNSTYGTQDAASLRSTNEQKKVNTQEAPVLLSTDEQYRVREAEREKERLAGNYTKNVEAMRVEESKAEKPAYDNRAPNLITDRPIDSRYEK